MNDTLTGVQIKVFKKLVGALQKNKIQFQVSGGLAAILYGSKRPLYDVDIEVYKKDIPRIREVFKNSIVKDYYNYKDECFDLWMLTLEIDGIPIDISQTEECRFFNKAHDTWIEDSDSMSSTTLVFDDLMVPVVDKNSLISYKKIISRGTDIEDVEQIQSSKS